MSVQIIENQKLIETFWLGAWSKIGEVDLVSEL